jgi:2-phospho-L-lactate guanylyltransferase
MKLFAIVPIKELDKAKSRLSTCLTTDKRKALLLAMLDDVTSALMGLQTIVISPEDMGSYLDGREGITFLMQKGGRDLNTAVKQANDYALLNGADATLFIPADMPLVSNEDIYEILKLGEERKVIITQARDGGTGILFRRPPDVMNSMFTKDSFNDHCSEARQRGIEMYVHNSLPLSVDIDTEEDIGFFMEYGEGTRTYDYLKKCGF